MNWLASFGEKLKEAVTGRNDAAANDSFQNFTPRAQKVLELARQQAAQFNHPFIDTQHLLFGVIELGQGVAFNVLERSGIDFDAVRSALEKETTTSRGNGPLHFSRPTPRLLRVFSLAQKERKALRHTCFGTAHLLLGLLHESDGVAIRVLKQFKVDLEKLRSDIIKEFDLSLLPGESW